jgi:hypothetical protein
MLKKEGATLQNCSEAYYIFKKFRSSEVRGSTFKRSGVAQTLIYYKVAHSFKYFF